MISKRVVDECGLKPIGRTIVNTAAGPSDTSVYLVAVYLPNMVAIESIRVTEGILGDMDLLIGMDVIGLGDFAVTNFGGKTVFSFSVPSAQEIDFVKEINRNAKKPRRSNTKRKRGTPR